MWENNGDFFIGKKGVIYRGGKKNEWRVGLILDENTKKCVLGFYQLSDKILVVNHKREIF